MSRLQDDLLKDFREQKKTIAKQIELFDPLATSLRKPVAQRLMNKGLLLVVEVLFYLLFVGAFCFAAAMNLVYPFTALSGVHYIQNLHDGLTYNDAEIFSIAVHLLGGIISILFLVIARLIRRIRLKNDVLDLAGKNIKDLVGQHLTRKASIDAIEQRHFLELPALSGNPDVLEMPNENAPVSIILSN
jgi:hypothetical protein